jgi:hypothetical protein
MSTVGLREGCGCVHLEWKGDELAAYLHAPATDGSSAGNRHEDRGGDWRDRPDDADCNRRKPDLVYEEHGKEVDLHHGPQTAMHEMVCLVRTWSFYHVAAVHNKRTTCGITQQ